MYNLTRYTGEEEYYKYSEEDRKRLAYLGLLEDDLGRYRGTRETDDCIIIETRDGPDEEYQSKVMLNHPLFCRTYMSPLEDSSYIDYYFRKEYDYI